MGAIVVLLLIALYIFWRIKPTTASVPSWASIETESSRSTSSRSYRTDRPEGPYQGPESWQLKGLDRHLFLYASEDGSVPVNDLPFAVLDLETTGLEPYHRHRVIEVSLALFSASGAYEQGFTTLVNPGIPIDNVPYHGITDEDVQDAPSMGDVLPHLLFLMSERVIVTHNAPFEEVFLFHAAQRAGLPLSLFCAVDTLSLARVCLDLPNHKLTTICDYLGIELDAPHAAEADALATAKLYMNLRKRRTLYIPQFPPPQHAGSDARPRICVRAPTLLKGTDGYMANLLKMLPISSVAIEGQNEAAYLNMLTTSLADRKLEKQEAQTLGKVALELGLSSVRVKELNASFLDAALTAAMTDARLEAEELRNLKTVAKLLGAPTYFDALKAERKRSTKKTVGAANNQESRIVTTPNE